MCGIAGKLIFDSAARVEHSEIERMLRPIKHRGPDGTGVYLDGNVGLGHARLAIIDLSTGDQPMCNEDESVWVVFNGEIYNFQELREKLLAKGHVFRTKSDTEVIIHAYEAYGADCVKHLRGMFAFAVWDSGARRLFIARDRVGIKPLYYCQNDKGFYFGSELKSIIAAPEIQRQPNLAAFRRSFDFYFPAGKETPIEDIVKLPAGHWLSVEAGKVVLQQYWDLQFTSTRWSMSFDEAVAELYALLGNVVRGHMIADVPVGVLLSGGIDSSAVLSLASRAAQQKVMTFTVGFDKNGVVDERPFARAAAARFNSEHFETSISARDFWEFLPSYVWHMEEPVCEPPAVALFYVSKLARGYVKVLLSGEGGDEAFAGYPNYSKMLRLQALAQALGPLARVAGGFAEIAGGALSDLRLRRYGYALGRRLDQHYFSRTSSPPCGFDARLRSLFTTDFDKITSGESSTDYIASLCRRVENDSLLHQMLYVDSKTWLPDDLLIKADKITMANSLELRVPLLDHSLLEFAASLPPEFKIRGKEHKRILRAAFQKVLPVEVMNRKKAGFPVPFAFWLKNDLRNQVHDLLLSNTCISRGLLRKRELVKLLEGRFSTAYDSKALFLLIIMELWHRAFIDSNAYEINV